jgi:hypothetical protein
MLKLLAGLAIVCMLTSVARSQAHVPLKSLDLQGDVFAKGASTGLVNAGAAAMLVSSLATEFIPSKAPQAEWPKRKHKNCKQTGESSPTVRGAGACKRGGGPGDGGK